MLSVYFIISTLKKSQDFRIVMLSDLVFFFAAGKINPSVVLYTEVATKLNYNRKGKHTDTHLSINDGKN